jgi:hypothetical protein
MNRVYNILISLVLLGVFSCSKDVDSRSGGSYVEYSFISNSPGQFIVNYTDRNGNEAEGLYTSGWAIGFTPTVKPFTANIKVLPFIG